MLATPTRTQIASALAVVQSPAEFADDPTKRALAWAILLATRGQRVNQLRLCQMQRAHRIALAAVAEAAAPLHIAIQRMGA